jgi:hypothetical protein
MNTAKNAIIYYKLISQLKLDGGEASLFLKWGSILRKMGDFQSARVIYYKGLKRNAEPKHDLETALEELDSL